MTIVPRDVSSTACLLRISSCDSGVVNGCGAAGRFGRTCADVGAKPMSRSRTTSVRMPHPPTQLLEASTRSHHLFLNDACCACGVRGADRLRRPISTFQPAPPALIPPASLPLETVVRNYATYRSGAHGWMLGRLIVPVEKLAELEALAR